MKKMLFLAGALFSLAACNDTSTTTTTTDTTTVVSPDTATTSTTTSSTTSSSAYTPSEGDVTRRDSKVLVYRNGKWVDADADYNGDNGVVITRQGHVTRDGKDVEIQEGETVNKRGDFFDRAGNAISNAWDRTKSGAKEVGKDIGNAAEKVGHKVKDAVDKDDKKKD